MLASSQGCSIECTARWKPSRACRPGRC